MVANTKPEKSFISCADVAQCVREIHEELESIGKKIDVVVGLSRGGLVPAVVYSHLTGVPLISVAKDEYSKINSLAETQSVLVIDDIVDTGATFREVSEATGDSPNVTFAALMADPQCEFTTSVNNSVLVTAVETDGSWIVFPWEQPDSD